ncbi:MAG: DUF3109 family protein [Chitinophagaceae bacterium]
MIAVDNVLISDEVVSEQFVCDLAKCKGGCCEEGDAGAPLTKEELDIIVDEYEKVKPYLTPASVAEIERKGKYVYHREFGWVTPTLGDDKEICVYGIRDEKGIIKCAFEQAYNDGIVGWKKPISCHFFPIIQENGKNGDFDRMNYEPREVLCKPACSFGKKLKVPVYQFLKEPIIRKYGPDFFEALDIAAQKFTEAKKR